MDDDDDYYLTREEIALYLEATRMRIKNIEQKALARLAMNDEEKVLYKAWRTVQKNPELRDLVVTMIIAGSDSKQT